MSLARLRYVIPTVAAIVMAAPAFVTIDAQDTAANTGTPVHVTVIVTDRRGDPVTKLGAGDFELRDDGALQTIDQVERPSATPPARCIALFLDEYHVRAGDTARIRAALTRFVDEDLRPDDVVFVMKPLESIRTIRPAQDRDEVRRAIATFEGRKDDYAPRSAFESTYMGRDPIAIESTRSQIVLSALSALTAGMGERREVNKALVRIGESFDPPGRTRGAGALPDLAAVSRSAAIFDVGISTVDPQGESDVSGALVRVVRDLDAGYHLTYRPAREDDGRFHAIQVRARGDGITVRVRSGYAAPMDPREKTRLAALSTTAPASLSSRRYHKSDLIKPWFGMSRGAGGRTQVTFTWEPGTPATRDRPQAWGVTVSAKTVAGDQLFTGSVSPVSPTGSPAAWPERAVFDAPPGIVQLEMTIESADQKVLDTDVRDLDVANLAGARTVIMPPEVLRTNTVRQFAAASRNPDAPPVASREFTRAEHLLIRVPAFGPGGSAATVTASLLNVTGQSMRNLPTTPGPREGETQFDLLLAPLAPGDYSIGFTATSDAGQAHDTLTFRIVD